MANGRSLRKLRIKASIAAIPVQLTEQGEYNPSLETMQRFRHLTTACDDNQGREVPPLSKATMEHLHVADLILTHSREAALVVM